MNVTEICLAALKRPTGDREAFLNEACAGDDGVRRLVNEALADYERSRLLSTAMPSTAHTRSPHIGRYKLLQRIGEGGMGEVWLAEQTEPITRNVALKLIKPGMDSAQVLARFEAERQALALMDHPSIAKVLDASMTDDGRPYFAMELVKGIPITRFCDERKLSTRERLELFVPVCQAIQHAHQKGIIHRDIKPSNVLVELHDDRPVPKVIDFGLAKAMGQRLTDRTLFTGFGGVVGTPAYMSPEQASFNALDVDTRSDVYSLGVVLYELLAGSPPFDPERLRTASIDEVLRIIREEEPPKPSTKLSKSDATGTVSAVRKTEPKKLGVLLRGELDWIVMRCLEKDRTRRYETANSLARDLQRHLADEPVEACPPSASYRLRKLARRYKRPLVTAAAFVALLLVGLVVSAALAVRASLAEERERDFAMQMMTERDRAEKAEADAETAAENATRAQKQAESDAARARRAEDSARVEAEHARKARVDASAEADRAKRAESQAKTEAEKAVQAELRARTEATLAYRNVYVAHMNLAQHAWENANLGRVGELLEGTRPRQGFEDLRSFDWYYLWRISHDDRMTLSAQARQGIGSLMFSSDGQYLSSVSRDGVLQKWNTETGISVASTRIHGHFPSVISADGKAVAVLTPAQGEIAIWDAPEGKRLNLLAGHRGLVRCLAFAPDCRKLASGGNDGTVRIWDIPSGKELARPIEQSSIVITLTFTPDGSQLVTGCYDGSIKVWDVERRKEASAPTPHRAAVTVLAISPDGSILATADGATGRGRNWNSTIKLWDLRKGDELATIPATDEAISALVFSPDCKTLASAGSNQTIKLWDVSSGKSLASLRGHRSAIRCLAYAPSGQVLASGGSDSQIKLWDTDLRKAPFAILSRDVTSKPFTIAFSADSKAIVFPGSRGIQRSDVTSHGSEGALSQLLDGPHARISLSPKGTILAISGAPGLLLLDYPTGKRRLSAADQSIQDLAFSSDGTKLVTATSKGLVLWNLEANTSETIVDRSSSVALAHAVRFFPDGSRLALARKDRVLQVLDVDGKKERLSLKLEAVANSFGVSPDGASLVVGRQDGVVMLVDANAGTIRWSAPSAHKDAVESVTFSPDGRIIASGSADGTIKLWDASLGKERLTLNPSLGPVRDVQFSPDGRMLAAGIARRGVTTPKTQSLQGAVILWRTAIPSGTNPAQENGPGEPSDPMGPQELSFR